MQHGMKLDRYKYGLLNKKRQLAKGDRFHWTRPAYDLLAEMVGNSILRELK